MTNPDDIAYLPIEKPPEGWRQPRTVTGITSDDHYWAVAILGPPVPALPDVSPEARAVLEAAAGWQKHWGAIGMAPLLWREQMAEALHAYAATLTPPDPLAEARNALEDIRNSRAPDYCGDAVDRLATALDRLAEKKDPT